MIKKRDCQNCAFFFENKCEFEDGFCRYTPKWKIQIVDILNVNPIICDCCRNRIKIMTPKDDDIVSVIRCELRNTEISEHTKGCELFSRRTFGSKNCAQCAYGVLLLPLPDGKPRYMMYCTCFHKEVKASNTCRWWR